MDDQIRRAFKAIKTEQKLHEETRTYLKAFRAGRETAKKKNGRYFIPVAAVLLLLIILPASLYRAYFRPVVYFDLDVNPSLEIAVNRFGRIIKAVPYNEEGDALLAAAAVLNLPYEKGMERLLDELARQRYLSKAELISLSIQTGSKRREEELSERLLQNIGEKLKSHHCEARTEIFTVSKEVKEKSRAEGLTPAKYQVISELMRYDPGLTYQGCRHHSLSGLKRMERGHRSHPQGKRRCEQ